eukprot:5771242-Pyramimonas_sp.AAC.1
MCTLLSTALTSCAKNYIRTLLQLPWLALARPGPEDALPPDLIRPTLGGDDMDNDEEVAEPAYDVRLEKRCVVAVQQPGPRRSKTTSRGRHGASCAHCGPLMVGLCVSSGRQRSVCYNSLKHGRVRVPTCPTGEFNPARARVLPPQNTSGGLSSSKTGCTGVWGCGGLQFAVQPGPGAQTATVPAGGGGA